jgi:hypothetical protein
MLCRDSLIVTGGLAFVLAAGACDSGGVEKTHAEDTEFDEPPPPQDELIDDLEDGDLEFLYADGSGYWVDRTSGPEPGISVGADGANETLQALGVSASTDGTSSTVTALLSPADATEIAVHDYSSCTGIEVWAKLDADVGAETSSLSIAVQSTAGTGAAEVTLSHDWQSFELEWEDFGAATVDLPELPQAGDAGGGAGAGGAGGVDEPAAGGEPGTGGAEPQAGGAAGIETQGAAGSGPAGAAGTAGAAGEAPAVSVGELDPSGVEAIHFVQAEGASFWVDELALKNCMLAYLAPPIPDPPELGTMGPAGTPVARHGQLQVVDGRLLDQSGDRVQLKGMSSMWLNWETSGYAESRQGLQWLRDNWNLSVVRAAMGVEASHGYIHDTARTLQQVDTIVQNAIALGVYVIIDFHSHYAHDYEAESRAFFADMARRYGEYPNVIYEPYNEPNMEPYSESWPAVIKPYHEAVISAIRPIDPDNLIVLGTPRWSQLVGVAAASPVRARNLLYALHFYSCRHSSDIRTEGQRALDAGQAVFVTEWGATDADGGMDGRVCADAAEPWLEWMESEGAWKWDDCTPDSTCILTPGAPLIGSWSDDMLHGHAPFVRDWMQRCNGFSVCNDN